MPKCKDCIHFLVCANVYGEVQADTEIINFDGEQCYYYDKHLSDIEKIKEAVSAVDSFNITFSLNKASIDSRRCIEKLFKNYGFIVDSVFYKSKGFEVLFCRRNSE